MLPITVSIFCFLLEYCHFPHKNSDEARRNLMTVDFKDKAMQIEITYETVKHNNMPRCHTHESYELYFLKEGERYLFAKGNFYWIRSGDLFLIAPGVQHRTLDSNSGEYTKLICMLPPNIIPKNVLPDLNFYITRPQGDLKEKILAEIEQVNNGNNIDRFASILKLLSCMLSIEEHRETVIKPSFEKTSKILTFIENHCTDKITVSELSQRFYISEYYLCRLFKEHTGFTIIEYVTLARLHAARGLLEQGNLKMEYIAKKSGFGSVSSFSAAFKKTYGISPRDYKMKNKSV